MNENVAILTDTNSGILPQQAADYGVHLISMPVIVDGESFFENETLTQAEFFARLRMGASVGTSQPSPGALMEAWELLLGRYDTVIYIPMSSGLSGGCQTAAMLAEEYDGRVLVVDNRRISITLRQSALEARRMLNEGLSAQAVVEALNRDGMNASIYVAVNTLEHLKQSGRVTAAGAALGTALNIKPVLQIRGGKLDAYKRSRGMKSAMQTMIDGVKRDRDRLFPGQMIVIRAAYSGDEEAGRAWQAALAQAFPENTVGLDALPISISCHTGEGALGVGLMKDMLADDGRAQSREGGHC